MENDKGAKYAKLHAAKLHYVYYINEPEKGALYLSDVSDELKHQLIELDCHGFDDNYGYHKDEQFPEVYECRYAFYWVSWEKMDQVEKLLKSNGYIGIGWGSKNKERIMKWYKTHPLTYWMEGNFAPIHELNNM